MLGIQWEVDWNTNVAWEFSASLLNYEISWKRKW